MSDDNPTPSGTGPLATERASVVEHALGLAGLTPGRTGNLSVRTGDQFAVTPTGVAYDSFDIDDVPVVNLDGEQVAGEMLPSSEVPMHRHIYRGHEDDPGAVVHTHSQWSTTMAVLREELPPIHYMIVAVGDRVPVAGYAPYGSEALAANVIGAMEEANSSACFIENHGLVVTADDLPTAMEHTRHVESLAELYLRARSVGDPTTLSTEQLQTVREKFESYGQE